MLAAVATGLFATACASGSSDGGETAGAETTGSESTGAQRAGAETVGSEGAGADLTGTHWVLRELNGSAVEGPAITAAFGSDGAVSGTGGCNTYGSTVTIDGDSIEFVAPRSTMMACDEATMANEAAYFEALIAARQFEMADEQLTILDESGTALAVFGVQAQDLAGSSWTVTGYNNGKEAVVSVLTGTTLDLTFNDDGTLNGNAGCNVVRGSFTTEDGEVSFGPLVTTRRGCVEPEGIMEQEAAYVAALESASTFVIDGGKLTMRTADDQIAVVFVAN